MGEVIIKTEKLSKSFSVGGKQQHVIKNLDLEIYKGDFTVIMGSSGAGKSTLLYALSGMDKPSLGTIEYAGKEITKMNDDKLAVFRRRHCGFIFQQIHLVDSMSVMDNAISTGMLIGNGTLGEGKTYLTLPNTCGIYFIRTERNGNAETHKVVLY